uniref:Uncharacterized protein n=1 Tax=Globodera rostochiensis TaxID=31243 RepID=A0A914I3D8_GLORO
MCGNLADDEEEAVEFCGGINNKTCVYTGTPPPPPSPQQLLLIVDFERGEMGAMSVCARTGGKFTSTFALLIKQYTPHIQQQQQKNVQILIFV